jgi:uracil-DNA glycosylase
MSPLPQANRLAALQSELAACRACPRMVGPVVHGPPVASRVLLIGQAPGPHEGALGRPFAWTAGKTMFRWFSEELGVDEARFRERVYMAAVARCFPGKAKGGGDRKPDLDEIARCQRFLQTEVEILEPELVVPVGGLALEQVLGSKEPLAAIVGRMRRVQYCGQSVQVIGLPHPSGASTWHRTEPGRSLLRKALRLLGRHPAWRATFEARPGRRAAGSGR